MKLTKDELWTLHIALMTEKERCQMGHIKARAICSRRLWEQEYKNAEKLDIKISKELLKEGN